MRKPKVHFLRGRFWTACNAGPFCLRTKDPREVTCDDCKRTNVWKRQLLHSQIKSAVEAAIPSTVYVVATVPENVTTLADANSKIVGGIHEAVKIKLAEIQKQLKVTVKT